MSGAQLTFWVVTLGLSITGTVLLYPGVKKHAASPRDSLFAAFMASALGATSLGFFLAAIVNAIAVSWG